MTRFFTLAALAGTFLLAGTARQAQAQDLQVDLYSTMYYVEVLMVDVSYPEERFYWSTQLSTTSRPEAELMYDLLMFAMEEGQLHLLLFGTDATRYTPADVRMTTERTLNYEFEGISELETLYEFLEREDMLDRYLGEFDTAERLYEDRTKPTYETPTYTSKAEETKK